jgi:hypothetical protein
MVLLDSCKMDQHVLLLMLHLRAAIGQILLSVSNTFKLSAIGEPQKHQLLMSINCRNGTAMKNNEIKQKLNLRKKTYSKNLSHQTKTSQNAQNFKPKKGISQTNGYSFHITVCL